MGVDRGAPQPAATALPFGALVGVMARTAGAAVLRRALPTYLGLFVVAVILFAGQGVRSSDVVALALGSPPTRFPQPGHVRSRPRPPVSGPGCEASGRPV